MGSLTVQPTSPFAQLAIVRYLSSAELKSHIDFKFAASGMIMARESILRRLDLEYIQYCHTPRSQQSIKRFRLALLRCDCLGARMYNYSEFVTAAEHRFGSQFDYWLTVQAASSALGWDGHCDARQYATIHMMHARGPNLPAIVVLILECSRLEHFADALWNADIDEHNMHFLTTGDLQYIGMTHLEAVHFILDLRIFRPDEYESSDQASSSDAEESSSETDSYQSVYSLPE